MLGIANAHCSKDASLAVLTPQELKIAGQYSGSRYEEFVTARYITKRAVQNLVENVAMDEIQVSKGVFEQPVLEMLTRHFQYDVSISHKENITGSLVFPRTHPVGIDIESTSLRNSNTLKRVTTGHEQQICGGDNASMMVVYSAKEALSKILRCGFTVPLHLLEVKRLAYRQDLYSGVFVNFSQYRFLSFFANGYVLTLVFPRNSACTIEMALST